MCTVPDFKAPAEGLSSGPYPTLNFVKFLRNFSTVSLQLFRHFFRINSILSCNFFKALTEKSEIFLKFQKKFSITFTKLFQNVSRIFSKFFGRTPVNARTFSFFTTCLLRTFFLVLS